MRRKPWQIKEDKQPWYVTWFDLTPKYRDVDLEDRKLIEAHVMTLMRLFVEERYEEFGQLACGDSEADVLQYDIDREKEHYPCKPTLPPPEQVKNLVDYGWQYDETDERFKVMWHAYISFWTEEEGRSDLTMTADILLNRASKKVRIDVETIGVP